MAARSRPAAASNELGLVVLLGRRLDRRRAGDQRGHVVRGLAPDLRRTSIDSVSTSRTWLTRSLSYGHRLAGRGERVDGGDRTGVGRGRRGRASSRGTCVSVPASTCMRAAPAVDSVNTPSRVSVGSRISHIVLPRRAVSVRRDHEHEAETLARDRVRAGRRMRVGHDAGEVVQRVHRDRRPAHVDAGRRREAGLQPGAVAAVDEAGGGDDGALERLVVVVPAGTCWSSTDRAAAQPLGASAGAPSARPSAPTPASGSCAARHRGRTRAGCGTRRGRDGPTGRGDDGRGCRRPARASPARTPAGRPASRRRPRPGRSIGPAPDVVAHGDQWSDGEHPSPLGRDPVAGAALTPAADRCHGHARRAIGTDGLDELEAGSPVERARRAVGADQRRRRGRCRLRSAPRGGPTAER